MLFFHYFYNSWQYFLLKTSVSNIHQFPKIKNLVVHIKLTKATFSSLCAGLLVLEMLTNQRPLALFSKKANLILKIRKGLPVGCKVYLGGLSVFNFLETFWVLFMSRVDADLFTLTTTSSKGGATVNVSIVDVFSFKVLEVLYFDFREYLTRLQVQINFQGTCEQINVVVQAFKLPL